MAEQNTEIAEIRLAEERRAQKALKDNRLEQLVKQLRKKYIADGFLMPFYVWDGRYSRPRQRIKEFGDFILHYSMAGRVFHTGAPGGWIRDEAMWFWEYLIYGQEAVYARPMSTFADVLRIEGMPAEPVWNRLVNCTRQMGLFGENGGGIVISPGDLDERQLARMVPKKGNIEGENGYMEPYRIEGEPLWIILFHRYEEPEYARSKIETRPAWFHITNYAFFNATITKLPIFFCLYKEGKADRIRFLDDELSDRARDFIGKELLGIPVELKNQLDTDTIRQERFKMTWWLWHNVGHSKYRRTLSYGEIADIARAPRSSIQTSVERFGRKLKEKLDGKLLERLLLASIDLGLGYNMTYKALVRQGLAPAREREIDSFDKLDKLI